MATESRAMQAEIADEICGVAQHHQRRRRRRPPAALTVIVIIAASGILASAQQPTPGELGIKYLIYQQQIWMAGNSAGAWEYMADRGSATANHYDHVHVSVY